MGYFPVLVGVIALVGIAVFFWKRAGPGSGRSYGNRIAVHIGIPRNVFWVLLENGVKGSSHELLASLQAGRIGMDEASIRIAPSLSRGLERLEARFGPQAMYDEAKPRIARLVAAGDRAAHEAHDAQERVPRDG